MLSPILSLVSTTRDSKKLTLKDNTGAYHVTTNPGGYGTPNIASPPLGAGFTFRKWSSDTPYLNFVTQDQPTIAALVGVAGYTFDAGVLGITAFDSAVHQIKYYPLEELEDIVATLTPGSATVAVTGVGTAPNLWNEDYVAAVILDGNGVAASNVKLISNKTANSFDLDSAWDGLAVNDYTIMLATEADLKVLMTGLANACVSNKIGDLVADNCSCGDSDTALLTKLSLWILAAKVKFSCKDYDQANDLITSAYAECDTCDANNCKTCS